MNVPAGATTRGRSGNADASGRVRSPDFPNVAPDTVRRRQNDPNRTTEWANRVVVSQRSSLGDPPTRA